MEYNILPVVQESVALGNLGGKVDQMAAEKQVVLGRYGERVAHEGPRVHDESTGHCSRDTRHTRSVCNLHLPRRKMKKAVSNVHVRVFLCVHHSSDGDTKVGDGTPEI